MKNKTVHLVAEKHLENLESLLKDLFKEEILTDVTIHCKDGAVKAHRVVLASCSPYFRKVFVEHPEQYAVFIMHGFTCKQMRHLMELIYTGSIDIPSELTNSVYEVAMDLEVEGITSTSAENEKINGYGRDTRFKGQKRVTVDFKETIEVGEPPLKVIKSPNDRVYTSSVSEKSSPNSSPESVSNLLTEPEVNHMSIPRFIGHQVPDSNTSSPKKPTVWALKQRKYKCTLCPSSFKRASHLTRHQLVHTGERPFACDQCDKAFSRHDKLKHHIRKAHLMCDLNEMNDELPSDSLYTIGHVQMLSPETSLTEMEDSPSVVRREDLLPVARQPQQRISPIRPLSPIQRASFPPMPQKKGRGRPRKYPPVPPPLIKRPRGRPRLNPLANSSLLTPTSQSLKRQPENYDITNMPFGDLEYLTKSFQENLQRNTSPSSMENLMEPYVEIKTEPNEKPEDDNISVDCMNSASSFLENIGLFEKSAVGQIGECTISVAN